MIAVDASPLVFQPRTGVARALDQLLLGWSRLAHAEPLVLLAPGPLEEGAARGFDVRQAPSGPAPSARVFRRWLPALVDDVGATAFYSPWSACPELAVPTVVLVHELPFVRHGPIEGRLRALAHRTWLRRNVERCAAIVTPSRATAEDLLALHPEAEERLHVIPNGFDPAPWEAVEDVSRERGPTVLMIGVGRGRRGARKKGLDLLLAVWARRGHLLGRLLLVGRPGLALPAHVRVEPHADDARLRLLMAEASVLAYPSRTEGFGYPPLEAMAAGTPVVASAAGAIPEVVGEAALLVPAGDAEALGAALLLAAFHEPGPTEIGARRPREAFVRAGRERARRFAPEVTADRLQSLLLATRESA